MASTYAYVQVEGNLSSRGRGIEKLPLGGDPLIVVGLIILLLCTFLLVVGLAQFCSVRQYWQIHDNRHQHDDSRLVIKPKKAGAEAGAGATGIDRLRKSESRAKRRRRVRRHLRDLTREQRGAGLDEGLDDTSSDDLYRVLTKGKSTPRRWGRRMKQVKQE
jgi:hypothetical protein